MKWNFLRERERESQRDFPLFYGDEMEDFCFMSIGLKRFQVFEYRFRENLIDSLSIPYRFGIIPTKPISHYG